LRTNAVPKTRIVKTSEARRRRLSGLSRRIALVALVGTAALLLGAFALAGATTLILPTHTPGVRYYKVTQATIGSTICVSGWTKTIRPPAGYTTALKKQQLAAWHYADQNPSHYEEDHLISLELGGAPRSRKNLWPEPRSQAKKSDPRENAWHRKVCAGTLTLRQAQKAELAYKRTHG
jgi:hypothetical protein